MMYSFAARSDCVVVDEPYYAAYLAMTGLVHPMRGEILASQSADAAAVTAELSGPNKGNRPHFYQKHMTHHMLPEFDLRWMQQAKNVFLIRHPSRVIASYTKKREQPVLDDLGYEMQVNLFKSANDPIVLDSVDIRANPEGVLRALCEALNLEFDPAMLHWKAGGHPDDGVWAAHWYGAVHQSTGFAGPEGPLPDLSGNASDLMDQAMPFYDFLKTNTLVT